MIQGVGIVENTLFTHWDGCCGLFVHDWFDKNKLTLLSMKFSLYVGLYLSLEVETCLGQIFGTQAPCDPCDSYESLRSKTRSLSFQNLVTFFIDWLIDSFIHW